MLCLVGAMMTACADDAGAGASGPGGDPTGGATTTSIGGRGAAGGGGSAGGTVDGGGPVGGGSGGTGPTDPCIGAADGDHCGSSLGGLAEHGSLYTCANGETAGVQPCPAGCESDACQTMASDPCESAQFGNGDYCGGSLLGGDPSKLYHCEDGSTASTQDCSNGCTVQPPGVPDSCAPSGDPCVNAGSGNGLYCGMSLGGDANTLYDCQNGATASSTQCAAGCQIMPPGVADACAPNGNAECCLARPPGALTQAYTACGGGGSHYGRDYGTAIGTPIYAGMSGTVVGSALGYPNCYDGGCTPSCWNSFNYVKVKADCGDPNDASKDFFIYYLHIEGLASGIANGSHVDQGMLLAYAGNSGCSSGPHIHIETASVPTGGSAVLNTCASVDPATRYCP
jgi:hypothetical protein